MTASERDALVGRVYSCVEAGLPARIDDTFSLLYEVERLTRERDAERQAREVTFRWYDERRAEVLRLTAENERLAADARRMREVMQTVARSLNDLSDTDAAYLGGWGGLMNTLSHRLSDAAMTGGTDA